MPVLLACLCILFRSTVGRADDTTTAEGVGALKLAPAISLPPDLLGRPLLKLEVVTSGGRWQTPEKLQKNTLGQPLTAAYVRAILRELLETVIQLMERPAEAKGLRLHLHIDPAVRLPVRGDPVRLRQVLGNLLSNAVKFTERGTVTVNVRRIGETQAQHQLRF